jgi:hypothetical protein
MMSAFAKAAFGSARPPDSLHVIRAKRYQTIRERGGKIKITDIGDVLLAMMAKPEDKTVQVEGCQALRDALVRPCT